MRTSHAADARHSGADMRGSDPSTVDGIALPLTITVKAAHHCWSAVGEQSYPDVTDQKGPDDLLRRLL
ncbi:hypothetical protein GCM10010467_10110 [Actinocorallia glomerata]|uniref:Uncharacterized protein n=2 Tax=Actinomycetes TaxID=1760 RepID=A0ABP6LVP8_9MICC